MHSNAVLRSGIIAVIGLGAGAAFLILGIAGVAFRAQCAAADTAGICSERVDPVVTGSTEPELPAPDSAAPEFTVATREVSPGELKLLTADRFIAATFKMLTLSGAPDAVTPPEPEVESAPAAPAAAQVVETAAVAVDEGTAEPPSPMLAKRRVTSVPVTADGQPVWPTAASAYAPVAEQAMVEPVAEVSFAGGGTPRTAAEAVAALEKTVEPLTFEQPIAAAPPVPHTRAVQPRIATPNMVRVGDSPVNVRSGPSTRNERLFALAAGATVEASGRDGKWVQIIDDEERTGWVYADNLDDPDLELLPKVEGPVASAEAVEPPAATSGDTRTVKGQGVNVRSGPSSKQGKLFALRGGEQVTVSGEERGWLKVKDDQGRTGWIYKSFLR